MRRAASESTDEPTAASARRAAAHRARRLDWRVAAARLEAGWPDEWGGAREDSQLDVFRDVDDSIATLLTEPHAMMREA